jgi:hypothetical protein
VWSLSGPRDASSSRQALPRDGSHQRGSSGETFHIGLDIRYQYQYSKSTMADMASPYHPDFRADITTNVAYAVDHETRHLILEQRAAEEAWDYDKYIELRYEMLRVRLRDYAPTNPNRRSLVVLTAVSGVDISKLACYTRRKKLPRKASIYTMLQAIELKLHCLGTSWP